MLQPQKTTCSFLNSSPASDLHYAHQVLIHMVLSQEGATKRHNSVTRKTWVLYLNLPDVGKGDWADRHLWASPRTPAPALTFSISPMSLRASPQGHPPEGPDSWPMKGSPFRRVGQEPEGEVKLRVQGSLFIPGYFALHTLPLSFCLLSPSSGRVEVCRVHGMTTALRPPLSGHRKHCLVPAWRVHHHPAESKSTDRAWSAWELGDL